MSKGRRNYDTIEIETTLGEMADSLPVMQRIISQPFAPGGAVQMYDRWMQIAIATTREVDQASAYEMLRLKMLREFGTLNEKTNQHEILDESKYKQFVKVFNELRAQPRTLTVCRLSVDEIDAQAVALGLTYVERFALDWLTPAAEAVG